MAQNIDDGHTLTDTVDLRPGSKAKLTIVYRPLLTRASYRYNHARARAADADKQLDIDLDMLLGQLVEWDRTKAGEKVPLSKAALEALDPTCLTGVLNLVCGYVARSGDEEKNS